MKIIHVITSLSKGGAERVTAELANEAVKAGNEVVIIAGWRENPSYLQNSLDSRISLRFISHTKQRAYFHCFLWIFKNRKWLAGYNVIHCHLTFGAIFGSIYTFFLSILRKSPRPSIFETYHAVGMMIPKWNRWLHAQMLKRRDGVIFMAKDKYWERFICNHPKLRIKEISNGISVKQPEKSLKSHAEFRANVDIPESCNHIVGTIGMLRPDRKPWLYVPIFKEIYNVFGDEVYFVVGGAGSEAVSLKTQLMEAGLEHKVFMPGLVTDPVALMSNLDVYVSLCIGPTVGISMFEAAMCSIPVVGIQLSKNYKADANDWIWSDSNPTKIALKIISLLNDPKSHRCTSLSQNKYVNEHFSSGTMSAYYLNFYNELLLTPQL